MNDERVDRARGGDDIHAVVFLLASVGAGPGAGTPSSLEQGSALPLHYQPPVLRQARTWPQVGRLLCLAALWQLCGNLLLLCESDDAEIVHQARIGWRRLRCELRLLRPARCLARPPAPRSLGPMVELLGQLRDLDVARLEVLPAFLATGAAGARAHEWRRIADLLDQAARERREQLRALLAGPGVGADLWAYVLWAAGLDAAPRRAQASPCARAPRVWARRRVRAIRGRLRQAEQEGADARALHRRRIWAKRLRYATEELRALLPARADRWHAHALKLQTRLGQDRDIVNTAALVERLGAPELASSLRRFADASPGERWAIA